MGYKNNLKKRFGQVKLACQTYNPDNQGRDNLNYPAHFLFFIFSQITNYPSVDLIITK